MKDKNKKFYKKPSTNHNVEHSVPGNESSFFPIKAIINEIIIDEMKSIEDVRKHRGFVTGVPTGFDMLDNLTTGLKPGNLIVAAARPRMGKTAFALAIALNAALHAEIPVALFSFEYSRENLVKRLVSIWPTLVNAANGIFDVPIFINDSAGISIREIKVEIGKIHPAHNIGLIIIDYLQLMRSDISHNTRDSEISEICRTLKELARELNLPIVVLSQVSRKADYRDDHRPCLTDLPNSSSIEPEADVVLFIYRDEVYNESEDNPNREMAEIIVAKHRNGPVGVVKLSFDTRNGCFTI